MFYIKMINPASYRGIGTAIFGIKFKYDKKTCYSTFNNFLTLQTVMYGKNTYNYAKEQHHHSWITSQQSLLRWSFASKVTITVSSLIISSNFSYKVYYLFYKWNKEFNQNGFKKLRCYIFFVTFLLFYYFFYHYLTLKAIENVFAILNKILFLKWKIDNF